MTHRHAAEVNLLQVGKQAWDDPNVLVLELDAAGESQPDQVGTVGCDDLQGGGADGRSPVVHVNLQRERELVLQYPVQLLLRATLLLDIVAKVGVGPERLVLGDPVPELADPHGAWEEGQTALAVADE